MNDHDLITALRDSFTDIHSDTPVEQIVRRSRVVRARRRVPALTAAVAVVAAAGLAMSWLLLGHSATVQPAIHLTAWTVVKHADGTVYVRINELRDPGGLQRKLRADGVPASVVFGNPTKVHQKPCQWYNGNRAGLLPKVVPSIASGPEHAILAIRPSALPAGAGVQIITMTNLSRIGVRLVSTSQGCTGS